jgi:hypothetical protein
MNKKVPKRRTKRKKRDFECIRELELVRTKIDHLFQKCVMAFVGFQSDAPYKDQNAFFGSTKVIGYVNRKKEHAIVK